MHKHSYTLVYCWGHYEIRDENGCAIRYPQTYQDGLDMLQAISCAPVVVATVESFS